ncbi:MAG: Brp/Blh family beta-carotene 15,15'-dioxygenase [Mariniblastus sp.]|nr:Brp/Blh family beta-carotene 15,15'-dioxygenase [Mariniblastus sp.]
MNQLTTPNSTRNLHTAILIVVVAFLSLLEGYGVNFSLSFVSALLACGVLLLGLPHGGMDQKVGLKLLARYPKVVAVPVFLTLYLSVAGVVISGWFLAPRLTILSFFILAAWHFGLEEQSRPARSAIAWFGSTARGGMVIWIPALFKGPAVVDLLTAILPSGNISLAEQVVFAIQAISPILIILLVYDLVFIQCNGTASSYPTGNVSFNQFRILAFGLLFAVANPLISFGVYFCLWHSIIGLGNLRLQFSLTNLELIRKIFPISGAAILFFVAGFIFSRNVNSFTPAILQSVFIGLSAVAVPHLLLHIVYDSKRLSAIGVQP